MLYLIKHRGRGLYYFISCLNYKIKGYDKMNGKTLLFITIYSVIIPIIFMSISNYRESMFSFSTQDTIIAMFELFFIAFFLLLIIQSIINFINKYSFFYSILLKILNLIFFIIIFLKMFSVHGGIIASMFLAIYLLTESIFRRKSY